MTKRAGRIAVAVSSVVFLSMLCGMLFALARRTGNLPTLLFGLESWFTTPRHHLELPVEYYLMTVAAVSIAAASFAARGSHHGGKVLFWSATLLTGAAIGLYWLRIQNILMLITLAGGAALMWIGGRPVTGAASEGGADMQKRTLVLSTVTKID